jgi:DNA-directed RNA polymerase specialized sigma24 family protein
VKNLSRSYTIDVLVASRKSTTHVSSPDAVQEEKSLTRFAFDRLLEWLDDGADSEGATYLEIRRRLVAYFDRRNRPSADDLAGETLNRVGRTLEASGVITISPPARYCYVVARFVLLEDIRRDRRHVPIDDSPGVATSLLRSAPKPPDQDDILREQRLECLDRCLAELKPEQRDLVIEYYRDTGRDKIERRRALAARLGISMNALGIRACRIRDTLEACVDTCGRRS